MVECFKCYSHDTSLYVITFIGASYCKNKLDTYQYYMDYAYLYLNKHKQCVSVHSVNIRI